MGYITKYRFHSVLEGYMLDPWGMENGQLVKLADYFSALFEAKIEASESPDFDKVYKKIKKGLHGFPHESVDYLFKFGIDYFEDNLEDIVKL